MTVKQTINDQCVSVRPVYRGGVQAAYWADIVNERALLRKRSNEAVIDAVFPNRLVRDCRRTFLSRRAASVR